MADRAPRVVTAEALHDALIAAGVVRAGEQIRRIVIDARAGDAVVMHVERFGDTRLLQVVPTLDGVEIREEMLPAESAETRLVQRFVSTHPSPRGLPKPL